MASGQPVAANAPVAGVSSSQLSVGPGQPDLIEDFPPETEHWISLAKIETGKGHKPPIGLRFSGGEVQPIKSWWQVLKEVAEGLVKRGTLTAAHCPMTGLGFINSIPMNPSGKAFFTPKQVSGGIYLNVQMNSTQIVSNSKKLLTYFDVDAETVELRLE